MSMLPILGKEAELVGGFERYRRQILGLTSMHSTAFRTHYLQSGWTLHYSGVVQVEYDGDIESGTVLSAASLGSCHQ